MNRDHPAAQVWQLGAREDTKRHRVAAPCSPIAKVFGY